MTHESLDSSVLEISAVKATEQSDLPLHLTGDELQKPSQYIFTCPDDEALRSLEQVRIQKSYIDFRVLDFEGEMDQEFLKSKFDLVVVRGPISDQALKNLNAIVKHDGKICHTIRQSTNQTRYLFNVIPHRQISNGVHHPEETITIIQPEDPSPLCQNFVVQLEAELSTRSFSVEKVSWNQHLSVRKGQKRIVLLELTSSFFVDLTAGDFEGFKRLVLDSSDLSWVTSFDGPASTVVTGLARAIRSEFAGLRFRTIQAPPDLLLHPKKCSELVARALVAASEEYEFMVKDERLEICRLYEAPDLNNDLQGTVNGKFVSMALGQSILPLKLGVGSPGMLDTLRFEVDVSLAGQLADDEVEIQVKASGVK
jgi:hypothetical protein